MGVRPMPVKLLLSLVVLVIVGSQPFADFSIGASLEPFVQHLNDGNRPPQPDGLNDSM